MEEPIVGMVVKDGAVSSGRLLADGRASRGGACYLLLIYPCPVPFCLAVPVKLYLSLCTPSDDLGRCALPYEPCTSMWIDILFSLLFQNML